MGRGITPTPLRLDLGHARDDTHGQAANTGQLSPEHLVLIEPEYLPKELEVPSIPGSTLEIGSGIDYRAMREQSVGEVEKKLLIHYLQTAGGNVTKACAMAGIPRRTFYRMMEKQGIKAKEVIKGSAEVIRKRFSLIVFT